MGLIGAVTRRSALAEHVNTLRVDESGGMFVVCSMREGAMTFSYRVDRWTDDGNSILDYVAAVGDAVARAAYRAACRRWPEAKISLRQGTRVMERSWEEA